jgi:phage terminase large subunit
LKTPARNKAFYGGRGGAKSHSFAQELVLRGYERKDFRWLFAREIQNSINASVKRLLEDKIHVAGLGSVATGGNGYYKITDRGITGGDGRTEFLFAGLRSNPDSVKSMEGLDGAWVEEANTVSKRSIGLLTPTVRKDDSELWWSWNRRQATDPVDNMFLGDKGPPPRSIVREVNWRDNPWFPEVLREEMEWDKLKDRDKWLHVWEGHPIVRSEARVFRNWTVEDLDAHIPADCVPRLGADWGFSVDPTVLVECFVWERTLYFRNEAYKIGCVIDEIPSLFAGSDDRDPPRWLNSFGHPGIFNAKRHRIIGDSARPDTIRYLKDRNFNIIPARKGAGSIEDGVEFMKSYDIVVHPRCQHVRDELTHYSYKVDPLTDEVIPELADKDNHIIDGSRYALEGVRRAKRGKISMVAPETVVLEE